MLRVGWGEGSLPHERACGNRCWEHNKRINCSFSGPFTLQSKCLIYFLFSRGSRPKIPLSITVHGSRGLSQEINNFIGKVDFIYLGAGWGLPGLLGYPLFWCHEGSTLASHGSRRRWRQGQAVTAATSCGQRHPAGPAHRPQESLV